MKKQELVEVTYCDICGKRGLAWECAICGKDFCYECQQNHTRRFRYLWLCGNDLSICNHCLAEPGATYSPLIIALRSMEAIRAESEAFYKEQNRRGEMLEKEIKRLMELTEVKG
jgi:hypothetical protein